MIFDITLKTKQTMEQLQEKFPDLTLALIAAKRMSMDHPDTDVYIIQERENYYVETGSGFMRSHEKLHGIFLNGKKVKQ